VGCRARGQEEKKGLETQANPEKCGDFPPENWHLTKQSWGLLGEDIAVSILAAGLFGSQVFLDHFQSCYCKYSHELIWEAKRPPLQLGMRTLGEV